MSLLAFFIFFIVYILLGPRIVITVLVYMFLGYLFCDINPEKTYYWYSGIWHGLFFIPNLIRSCFYSDVLFKANVYTTAYNIWWWIFTILSVSGFFCGGAGSRQRY